MKKFYNRPKSIQIVVDLDGMLMQGTLQGDGTDPSKNTEEDPNPKIDARTFSDDIEW